MMYNAGKDYRDGPTAMDDSLEGNREGSSGNGQC